MLPSNLLTELQITFIPDYELEINSFYVKRPYGNYLFFTHPKVDSLNDFIKNSGGIYKIFEYYNVFAQKLEQLFRVYGCALVNEEDPAAHNKSFKQDKWPEDFYDPAITFYPEYKAIELIHKKKKILFVDNFNETNEIPLAKWDYVLYRRFTDNGGTI